MSGEDQSLESDVVERSIGPKGKWQYILCVAMTPLKITVGTLIMSFVFMAPPPQFSCSKQDVSKCSDSCPSHQFNESIFSKTIITEWDLVCDNSQMANLAQTIFMFGLLVGSVLYGYLADKYGRLKTMVWATFIQGFGGIAASFAPWYWLFVVMRFVCATATSGNITINFIYIMEVTGRKWRTIIGIVMQEPLNFGMALTPLWSYFIRDWRTFQLAISIPTILCGCYVWMLPESPRWLLAVGRTEEAVAIMEKAARTNKLSTKRISQDAHTKSREAGESKTGNMWDLIRTPSMRKRSICIFVNWLVCGLCFYGEAQFMGQIGNVFINIAVPNLVQTPSDFVGMYLMGRFGRKYTLILFYLISSCCMFAIVFISPDNVLAISVLGAVGLVAVAVCFSIMFIFTGELYPTVIRNIGSGYASMFARIGSMSAPYIASISTSTFWVSPFLFGLGPLISASLCLLLPETNNCYLPDTIEEAEYFFSKDVDRVENGRPPKKLSMS